MKVEKKLMDCPLREGGSGLSTKEKNNFFLKFVAVEKFDIFCLNDISKC